MLGTIWATLMSLFHDNQGHRFLQRSGNGDVNCKGIDLVYTRHTTHHTNENNVESDCPSIAMVLELEYFNCQTAQVLGLSTTHAACNFVIPIWQHIVIDT